MGWRWLAGIEGKYDYNKVNNHVFQLVMSCPHVGQVMFLQTSLF